MYSGWTAERWFAVLEAKDDVDSVHRHSNEMDVRSKDGKRCRDHCRTVPQQLAMNCPGYIPAAMSSLIIVLENPGKHSDKSRLNCDYITGSQGNVLMPAPTLQSSKASRSSLAYLSAGPTASNLSVIYVEESFCGTNAR